LSNENIHIEIIDRYLNGEMSDQERIAFENQIAIDGDLAARVKETELVNEAVHYASLAALREEVGKDIKKIRYKEGIGTVKTTGFILAALAAAILTIAYFHNNPGTSGPTDKAPASDLPAIPDMTQPHDKKSVIEYSPDKNTTETISLRKAGSDQISKQPEIPVVSSDNESSVNQGSMPSDQTVDADTTPIRKTDVPHASPADPVPAAPDMATPAGKAADCEKAYKIKSTPSCRSKATGSISVLMTNNTKPALSIENYGSSSVNGTFNELQAGTHTVYVFYNDECHFTEEVTVEEKWCPMNKSYSFNPDYGERWEIAYEKGDAGTFSIFTSGGKEVYRSNFGQGNEHWGGHDTYGALSAIGTYLVIIRYSDGRTEKVELTIVR